MAKKTVWICPFTAEPFELSDPRLIGTGMPPSSPNTPPGMGMVPMMMMSMDVAEATTTKTEKK